MRESVYITSPKDQAIDRPERSLFNSPVQVVVLGVDGDEVKLGIYAHPCLKFEQGPQPDAQWQQRCEADRDYLCRLGLNEESSKGPVYAPVSSDTSYALVEDNATDELDALAEAHYFLYQALEAVFDSHETRMAIDWPLAKSGFVQLKDWLLARETEVRRLAREEQARSE